MMASKKKKVEDKKALSEKKKKLTAKKNKLKKLEDRLKKVDKELALIEKELRSGGAKSKIVEADLKRLERKLMHLEVEEDEPKTPQDPRRFYRKFVFKCKKCKGQFDKKVNLPTVSKKLVCPACGKDHTLGLYPSSRFYHVSHSKDIEIKK
ncbi:MAG: hypothetical protein ABH834_07485 [Candidatus Altiarchaeota archaeon]